MSSGDSHSQCSQSRTRVSSESQEKTSSESKAASSGSALPTCKESFRVAQELAVPEVIYERAEVEEVTIYEHKS
ncbi:hypothetical protein EB796_002694 [Bugula neritina]|uniref:Uncharacterized protein n=1 Tax=Bugula neritina TaxID=10212 RepID=A0A7J7KLI7_BUGNE|nr:hypothetical protein EB796_002694 [Bugula neritina]